MIDWMKLLKSFLRRKLPSSPQTAAPATHLAPYRVGKLPITISGSLQNPAFSPDAQKLSFTRWRKAYNTGRADIGIYDFIAGTTQVIPLKGQTNVSQPGSCWSSRGIIFSSDAFGPDRACYWDGREMHVLFKPSTDQTWEPSWGHNFYVTERHRRGKGKGQIIKASLSNLDEIQELTSPHRDCRQPCVSPDSRSVVFQERIGHEWRIKLLTEQGERDLGLGTDITFSSSGNRLLFSDENGRLTVLDLVTGTRHNVNVATKYSGAPSFAPGDAWIAYEGGPSGEDGGTPTAIYLTKSP